MKSFFSWFTSLSLRFRAVTLILVVIVSVLGVVATTQLNQELIPPIELPQTYILAQVSGMTSEQVLKVLTERIETELAQIPEIINIESTTTSALGTFITASNDFGLDQQKLRNNIQAAIDRVWLPQRSIRPAEGQSVGEFADQLLADVTPDFLLYLAKADSNFLFQLSPAVWNSFSDETVRAALSYLAAQVEETTAGKSALERLVEQEMIPRLQSLDYVARVSVSGGQALPGENTVLAAAVPVDGAPSRLLKLSPEVWSVVSAKVGEEDELNDSVVARLKETSVDVPKTSPALPESWRRDHFSDATDILEIRTATQSTAGIFNSFRETGRIAGALGQTDDLTPEAVKRMLEIEPSLVEYFEAEQLVAMSPEVFAALPDDFIANLDGFTRDELAAASLAESITGVQAAHEPADLPAPWRISPPRIITFSFADLPLATFSVFSNGAAPSQEQASASDSVVNTTPTANNPSGTETAANPTPTPIAELPEGPALPRIFGLFGSLTGMDFELDTADDLVNIQLPESLAAQFGTRTLKAADFFNFLVQLDPSALAAGTGGSTAGAMQNINPTQALAALAECNLNISDFMGGSFDIKPVIGCISADAISFIAAHDPTFLPNLTAGVYDAFSDEVLLLPDMAPPLADVWDTLANQPQFRNTPLRTAADVIAIGGGEASKVLNIISETVPERFKGYDVRLFDSLSTGVVRYFALKEGDFYAHLDTRVLESLSPQVLALLPQEVLDTLNKDTADKLAAIANGEQPSAAEALAALYTTDVPPGDPTAPALNSAWAFVGDFYGLELNTADDFFRFPSNFPFPNASAFMNSIFDSPQGAAFAPNLFGGMSVEMVDYMLKRDAGVFDDLRAEALQLLPEDVLKALPQAVQERATSSAEPFKPTAQVTRTNGSSSLLVTIYKDADANTVQAYHQVEDVIEEIDAKDDSINTQVAFEQASFIEESISGVAREGGLGAIFAVVVILLFLSGGVWSRSPRQITGFVLIAVFVILLGLVTFAGLDAAGGDLGLAFARADVVVRVLLILGVVIGFAVLLWPGNLPNPSWRSTLVTAISIPLSVLMALALMRWMPPFVHGLLAPSAESSPILQFVLRLFPESITLNIMTLSGLTVAIGRVVDDSIVVLENIFRHIQAGEDKRAAIIAGTRDVSVAIFVATLVTVVVFLPLGLTGGIIGAFFLPFGLAVTYALGSSFVVAITVIPVLVFLLVKKDDVAEEQDGLLSRVYLSVLRWALGSGRNRRIVLAVAIISMLFGFALFASRPTTFLPDFGEPEISISVNLPAGTKILETNEKVMQLEKYIQDTIPDDELSTIRTIIGSGGLNLATLIGGGGAISENAAQINVTLESQGRIDARTQQIRQEAEKIFGVENVTVSAQSITSGGFGGFSVVVSGSQADLLSIDSKIVETLEGVEGLANISSNLSQVGGTSDDGPITYLRVDLKPAVSYTGELETENTLGVTQQAIQAIKAIPDLPESITVSQGFQSELQTQGFASLFVAMGIAIAIVVVILIVTFGSLVHWLDIILSIIVAPVGAAVALTLTNRVLGISAMIGMLMLIGIVVTNAVVLIDRVQSNRYERGMNVYDALIEAGGRRLRPILMTALATIMALMPLAIGLSKGAIIASELGTVVIGGLFSSTLLTLIVVPVAYSLLAPVHKRLAGIVSRSQ